MNDLTARHRKSAWQRANRAAFRDEHGYSTTAHYSAGGNREPVLKRDGFSCVKCGMTDEEHKAAWGKPITIDHINKDRSDNSLDNLQTLCLTCHGRKDLVPRLREKTVHKKLPLMTRMRAEGRTYQEIADAAGVSIASAWKYLNGPQQGE